MTTAHTVDHERFHKQRLLTALQRVRARTHNFMPKYGICFNAMIADLDGNICAAFDARNPFVALIERLFKAWPGFSGDDTFPVPHPTDATVTPFRAYRNLLPWQGDYGTLRTALLDFMIHSLTVELNKP